MKILIASDTHGLEDNLERAVAQESPFDVFIHCGDIEGQEDYIRALVDCETHMVRGNNDFFSDLNREEEFMLGKYKVMLTHGQYYGVSMGSEMVVEEAKARGVQIVMFGHSHRPSIEMGDVIAINPGSLSYPRQSPRRPSYIVMNLDENEKIDFVIEYL